MCHGPLASRTTSRRPPPYHSSSVTRRSWDVTGAVVKRVASPLAARHKHPMTEPDARTTWEGWQASPAASLADHVAEARLVSLAGNVPPWTATGVRVRAGEWITLLASGRLVLAEALDLWL